MLCVNEKIEVVSGKKLILMILPQLKGEDDQFLSDSNWNTVENLCSMNPFLLKELKLKKTEWRLLKRVSIKIRKE